MTKAGLRIGELAAQVRLRPSALRYYEQAGLIPPPPRASDGTRRYPPSTIRRVALIKMAQRAGLGIADIRGLLATSEGRPSATRQWRDLAARKLPQIDAIISGLTELRAVIAACLDCGCMDFENCQLLASPADPPG
ncbi:MAG TPA: MerR family transcriptional regulator [Trebonia sp.]|nr:MerR family transcriptional regulator [Trebonia sp.]